MAVHHSAKSTDALSKKQKAQQLQSCRCRCSCLVGGRVSLGHCSHYCSHWSCIHCWSHIALWGDEMFLLMQSDLVVSCNFWIWPQLVVGWTGTKSTPRILDDIHTLFRYKTYMHIYKIHPHMRKQFCYENAMFFLSCLAALVRSWMKLAVSVWAKLIVSRHWWRKPREKGRWLK